MQLLYNVLTRHAGIPLPSLPSTEAWTGWTLVLLACMLLYLALYSRHFIAQQFGAMFSRKERESIFVETSLVDFRMHLVANVFSIATYSLAAYTLLFSAGSFSLLTYAKFIGVITAFFAFKIIMIALLSYVFFNGDTLGKILKILEQFIFASSVLAYVATLCYILLPPTCTWFGIACFVVCALWLVVLYLTKIFQLFLQKVTSLLYLFLYLCTLEILPFLGLYDVLKAML